MAVKRFKLTMDNTYWNMLKEANEYHVSARQKYLQLTGYLKSHGVAFGDVRNYLLNQAKDAGLYRKTYWDDKGGSVTYAPKKSLKRLAWYRALDNYLLWINRNYDKSYDVPKVQTTQGNQSKETPKVISKTTTITRKKGGEDETRKETVTTTSDPSGVSSNSNDSNDDVSNSGSGDISRPVGTDLTLLQTQAIVLGNLQILGEKAVEVGAVAEFNSLMLKLSLFEELIEEEEYSEEDVELDTSRVSEEIMNAPVQ